MNQPERENDVVKDDLEKHEDGSYASSVETMSLVKPGPSLEPEENNMATLDEEMTLKLFAEANIKEKEREEELNQLRRPNLFFGIQLKWDGVLGGIGRWIDQWTWNFFAADMERGISESLQEQEKEKHRQEVLKKYKDKIKKAE